MTTSRNLGTFRQHLILTSVTSTAVFAGLVGASLFVPLVTQLDRTDLDSQFAGGIAEHILYLHRNFWPVVLGSLLASIASGMVLYYRMTSPLVRFQRIFHEIARGVFPETITLRKTDYLGDTAESLNRMVETLREGAVGRATALAGCQELLDEILTDAVHQGGQRARLEELRDALKSVG
jgi:methyl-accepting chemotaxis protein